MIRFWSAYFGFVVLLSALVIKILQALHEEMHHIQYYRQVKFLGASLVFDYDKMFFHSIGGCFNNK